MPMRISRRIIMQKARRQPALLRGPPTACRHVVSGSLSSPCGVLPIFRSRYWFTIGHQRVFSLAGWSPQIRTHFHVLSRTQEFQLASSHVPYGAFTFYGRPFLTVLVCDRVRHGPTTPAEQARPVWAVPLSLAATDGIEVSFSSSRY